MLMPLVSPGTLPSVVKGLSLIAKAFVLPPRRERHYPRAVKNRPQRYALRLPIQHTNSLN